MSRQEAAPIKEFQSFMTLEDYEDFDQAGRDAASDDRHMRSAIHWLETLDDDPRGHIELRRFYELQVRHLAGKLAGDGDTEAIDEVIERYREDERAINGEA